MAQEDFPRQFSRFEALLRSVEFFLQFQVELLDLCLLCSDRLPISGIVFARVGFLPGLIDVLANGINGLLEPFLRSRSLKPVATVCRLCSGIWFLPFCGKRSGYFPKREERPRKKSKVVAEILRKVRE
jgi:hypothetical protein